MKLPYVRPENLRTPPKGLLTMLMRVSSLEGPIGVSEVGRFDPSESGPRVFLHHAERSGLLIRGTHGRYYPVDMRVVLLSSLITEYYRTMWRVHDVLERHGVAHAFACLTSASQADYLPSAPIVAITEADFPKFSKADFFGLVIGPEDLADHSSTVSFEWDDGTEAFEVRELDHFWTSLLLGAIGLPREVAAARRLLEGMDGIDDDKARRLNTYGLSPRKNVLEKERSVLVPDHIDEMRAMYAEALRQLEVRGGERDGQ